MKGKSLPPCVLFCLIECSSPAALSCDSAGEPWHSGMWDGFWENGAMAGQARYLRCGGRRHCGRWAPCKGSVLVPRSRSQFPAAAASPWLQARQPCLGAARTAGQRELRLLRLPRLAAGPVSWGCPVPVMGALTCN